MSENIDYKKLYEEAQMKLDKFEKDKIEEELGLTYSVVSSWKAKELQKYVHENRPIAFFRCINADDTIDEYIKEIGFEKLWKVVKEICKEALEENKLEKVEEKEN